MNAYTAFFCEENIWHLAQQNAARSRFVLLFFNAFDTIAVCHQKVFEPDQIGCWDYHVVLFDAGEDVIVDYDTRLGAPVSARDYLAATFPRQQSLAAEFRAQVRVVPAEEYRQRFSSDRRHMLDENGAAQAPFPDWPAISSSDPISLQEYISGREIAHSASFVIDVDALAARLQGDGIGPS